MPKQCKACPWKKSTVPDRDIPGGYCETLHKGLANTIATPGSIEGLGGPLYIMACHESTKTDPRICVGWAVHQLGPGNNIALRLKARHDTSLHNLQTVGPQHETLEDTLPKGATDDRRADSRRV